MAILGLGKKQRVLTCRDAGMDCEAVFKGKNDDDVLRQAAEHAEKAHGMKPTAEMGAKLRKLIKNR